jgi:hypothetical protein
MYLLWLECGWGTKKRIRDILRETFLKGRSNYGYNCVLKWILDV